MKHILVLTDFSDNAKQAAKNAVYLCEKLNIDAGIGDGFRVDRKKNLLSLFWF